MHCLFQLSKTISVTLILWLHLVSRQHFDHCDDACCCRYIRVHMTLNHIQFVQYILYLSCLLVTFTSKKVARDKIVVAIKKKHNWANNKKENMQNMRKSTTNEEQTRERVIFMMLRNRMYFKYLRAGNYERRRHRIVLRSSVSMMSGCKLKQIKWPGNRLPNWQTS